MIDTVVCPACRRALRVPDTLHGQLVKCPACEQTFTASDDLEAAPRRFGEVLASPEEDGKRQPEKPFARRWPGADKEPVRDRPLLSRPGKAQAIAILTLIGGIIATLWGCALVLSCVGLLWPGTYFTLVTGILCIIKGVQLLGSNGRYEAPPLGTAILQVVNVINLDLINVTLGILNLVFLNDPQVRQYYRG
jgi:hypothetical protein